MLRSIFFPIQYALWSLYFIRCCAICVHSWCSFLRRVVVYSIWFAAMANLLLTMGHFYHVNFFYRDPWATHYKITKNQWFLRVILKVWIYCQLSILLQLELQISETFVVVDSKIFYWFLVHIIPEPMSCEKFTGKELAVLYLWSQN